MKIKQLILVFKLIIRLFLPRNQLSLDGIDLKGSPLGGSTLITLAPKSAITMDVKPPAGPKVKSKTLMPVNMLMYQY